MFDPAAMGTLLIGLDLDDAETQTSRRRDRRAPPRRRAHAVRMAARERPSGGPRRSSSHGRSASVADDWGAMAIADHDRPR